MEQSGFELQKKVILLEKKLNVKGMHCNSCVEIIKDSVEEIPDAKVVSAEQKKGEITVSFDSDSTLEKIKKAIAKEGYTVE